MAAPGTTRPNFSPTRAPSSGSTPSPSPQVDGLGDALLEQGRTESRTESRQWAASVVTALKKQGLFGASLKSSLAKVQAEAGLATTGKLDGPTIRFLESKGWAPKLEGGGAKAPAGDAGKADASKGADKTSSKAPAKADGSKTKGDPAKGVKGKPPKAPGKSRDPNQLAGRRPVGQVPGEKTGARGAELGQGGAKGGLGEMLQNLMTLGFLGAKRGGEALTDAIRSFQASVQLPQTGQMNRPTEVALKKAVDSKEAATSTDAPEGGGSGKRAGQEAKVDARTSTSTKGAKEAARSTSAAAGQANSKASTHEQARSQTQTGQDATMRGTPEQGQPQAQAGRVADGQGQAIATGHGGHGAGQVAGATGAVQTDDTDGTEDVDTNAHAGDEDLLDEERGWANLKGEGASAGYWEVPRLSEQIVEALECITRDDDGSGAATYRWDVTFYRPGVYGAGQPATPLWHIGIEQVTAFDPVWGNARDVLTRRLAQVEPEAAELTPQDFESALRRARVRGVPAPEESAAPVDEG